MISSRPDWQWFGSLSENELAEAVQDNPNVHWIQNAYAWIKDRQSQGPSLGHVPFLTVNVNSGQLGFLTIDEKPIYGKQSASSEFERHAYTAAKFVFDLFKPLQHNIGDPLIIMECDETGSGSSLSLPAMIAALQLLIGLQLPDTICSTGDFVESSRLLAPVKGLDKKIAVAKRFGYKRLVLVDGQPDVPENPGIEPIYVRSDPLLALFDLLKLENDETNERRLAHLLAIYAQNRARAGQNEIEEIVTPFLDSNSRLVCHVVNDILSRAALHIGKTAESEKYHKEAGQLEWCEYPTDGLGHYLRYEQTALNAEIAVDSGVWEDDGPIHQAVDLRVDHLQTAIDNQFADANDYFAALALRNTRAMRRRFLARLNQKPELLLRAWNDLMTFYGHWEQIWKFAKSIGRNDSTFERQRNYCLETLADEFAFHEKLPQWAGVDEFFESLRRNFTINDGYDIIAKILWHVVRGEQLEIDAVLQKADELYAEWKNYPNFLPYEQLLRYDLCNDRQRDHCLDKLRQAGHLTPEPTSILTLLALRTRVVLEKYDRKLDSDPVCPPEGTPLRNIFEELQSNKETLIARCPY